MDNAAFTCCFLSVSGFSFRFFRFTPGLPKRTAAAPAPAGMPHEGSQKNSNCTASASGDSHVLKARATGIVVLLLGNIIYVGPVTIAQKRLDWMLGYLSAMHMVDFSRDRQLWCLARTAPLFSRLLTVSQSRFIRPCRRIAQTWETWWAGSPGSRSFAGLAFGLGVFAAIGLPGFANFAGAFRNDSAKSHAFTCSKLPPFPCAMGRGDVDGLRHVAALTGRRSWAPTR